MNGWLGVDVGSVSTNLVLTDERFHVLEKIYLPTSGDPIAAVREGISQLHGYMPQRFRICGAGTTGSGRALAAVLLGADIVKNEITAHGVAALSMVPDVQTVFEIGGQDSKIILLRNGVIADFAMNTVCAAGTGSFLDRQAARLGISIGEFGMLALRASNPVRIAGRCAVFAESDMIHKQQLGYAAEDIVAGLCEALVRNYLGNVGKGKDIREKIVFQGGVAANAGIARAFEKTLQLPVHVPAYYDVMGAIGAAILAGEAMRGQQTRFTGFAMLNEDYSVKGMECNGCDNRCEIVQIMVGGRTLAYWGDRCGKWSAKVARDASTVSV